MVPYRSRSGSTRPRPLALVAVALAFVLLAPASSQSLVQDVHIGLLDGQEVEDFDSRTAVQPPTAAQRAQAAALGAEVRWNQFGTPQSMIDHGGFLATDIAADDAESAARSWVDANAGLFRLDPSASLDLHAAVPLRGTSAHVLVFRQRVDGLLVSPDGFLSVGVVGSADDGWDVVYASSTLVGADDVRGEGELTATEALVEAAGDVGVDIDAGDVERVGAKKGWTVYEVEGLEGEPQLARAVAFPAPKRGVLRAFETVFSSAPDAGFRHVIDADTGEVLLRESIVDHLDEDNPKWKVFPAYPRLTPINRHPWNYPSPDTRNVWCWTRDRACRLFLEGSSPHPDTPWDVDARTGTPTLTTTGNNARSAENWFDPFFPGPTQYQPISPTRDYVFPWQNVWFERQCDPEVLVPGEGNDIDAATTNLFAGHNRMHDWAYHLGFTEETWNAQEFNFGKPTLENDSLIGMVQAGAVTGGPPTYAGRDNAFMRTLPDGMRSQSGMFLWQPIPGAFYAPCVDGDYDMAVIGHEYTHMIENRMIGKGFRRTGFHAGAMGESYADFIAMEYLNEYKFVPVSGEHPWAVGAYVTGNGDRAIRNYNMAYPSSGRFPQPGAYSRTNTLNFSTVGYDLVGPQVHADGEIWSATNFDIRELFLNRYPDKGARQQVQCADGKLPADKCPGNRRWIQVVFDAFLLMPTAPTFLDARDAYLAADMMRFGGANQDLLWLAFARRGFGQGASTTGPNDTEPIPSFESPLHEEATLVFDAVAKDEGNAPIADAKVFVGHYEGRVTPAAVTAPGTNALRIVPDGGGARHRGYDLVAQAPGYGHVRFRISNLKAGEVRNVTIRFATNWASMHKGATATGDGTRHADLIDDTEGTNWQSTGAPVQGRQVVVELPGLRTFDLAKVSAHLLPGQNRFTALRAFELYACTATPERPCDPADAEVWSLIHQSDPDAFPGDNPRPVAPALILRTFDVPTTTATHVKLVVVDNQCTGQTSFQGKQDADPRHETDCRIGTPLPRRDLDVRAAELQLHSSKPEVVGAKQTE